MACKTLTKFFTLFVILTASWVVSAAPSFPGFEIKDTQVSAELLEAYAKLVQAQLNGGDSAIEAEKHFRDYLQKLFEDLKNNGNTVSDLPKLATNKFQIPSNLKDLDPKKILISSEVLSDNTNVEEQTKKLKDLVAKMVAKTDDLSQIATPTSTTDALKVLEKVKKNYPTLLKEMTKDRSTKFDDIASAVSEADIEEAVAIAREALNLPKTFRGTFDIIEPLQKTIEDEDEEYEDEEGLIEGMGLELNDFSNFNKLNLNEFNNIISKNQNISKRLLEVVGNQPLGKTFLKDIVDLGTDNNLSLPDMINLQNSKGLRGFGNTSGGASHVIEKVRDSRLLNWMN